MILDSNFYNTLLNKLVRYKIDHFKMPIVTNFCGKVTRFIDGKNISNMQDCFVEDDMGFWKGFVKIRFNFIQ